MEHTIRPQELALLDKLLGRYQVLEVLRQPLLEAFELLVESFTNGHKLLVCGNGGSAADADHIVGELMKGFYKPRPLPTDTIRKLGPKASSLQGALPAISLVHPASLLTAFINDIGHEMMYAQQVYGLGSPGDVFIGISTSGNAVNVNNAAQIAQVMGLTVISLTGQHGGALKAVSQVCLAVPATVTAEIQELHLPVYHTLCAMLEEHFFG